MERHAQPGQIVLALPIRALVLTPAKKTATYAVTTGAGPAIGHASPPASVSASGSWPQGRM